MDLTRVVLAAQHNDVGGDLMLVELHGCAVKADIGNMVASAAVRTAADLDMNFFW